MNSKEHKEYIEALKVLTSELLESKEASQKFYKSAGIHTKSGNLTTNYNSNKIVGYRISNSKK